MKRAKGAGAQSRLRPLSALLRLSVTGLLALASCEGISPLRGDIDVGREPYIVFVGGGGIAGGDLYAVRTQGGVAVAITFSVVGEMRPALSPDGIALAFLRGESLRDSVPGSIWVLNLLNGAEREIPLPKGAGRPQRVGWSADGQALVVATDNGMYRADAPPKPVHPYRVSQAGRATAESSLSVLLGNPVFARAVPCANPSDLCVQGDTGSPGLLAADARDAARWGDDSVAYLEGGSIWVRPLGPGRARPVEVSNASRPRQITVFLPSPGQQPTSEK